MFPFMEEFRCPLCKTRHGLRFCRRFLAMHPKERAAFVHQENICENCLGLSYTIQDCHSGSACRICWLGHYTLLHGLDESQNQWLQMTALALVHYPGQDHEKRLIRIKLDPNVSESYIAPPWCRLPFMKDYDVTEYKVQITDRHTGVRTVTAKLKLNYHGREDTPKAFCVPRAVWKQYDIEDVADTSFYLPYSCSIVLGRDVSKYIYLGPPQEQRGLPYVQKTIFGFTFFGALATDHESDALTKTFLFENTNLD